MDEKKRVKGVSVEFDKNSTVPIGYHLMHDICRRIASSLPIAVYGDEDEHVPDTKMNCSDYLGQCKAGCCKLIFALTKDEVEQGDIEYDRHRPYLIARDVDDGYCPHLDKESLQCSIWHKRPIRCRRYHCRDDMNIWPSGFPEDTLRRTG